MLIVDGLRSFEVRRPFALTDFAYPRKTKTLPRNENRLRYPLNMDSEKSIA